MTDAHVRADCCTRCAMDRTDPGIEFDDHGVCSHCSAYDRTVASLNARRQRVPFDAVLAAIRHAGEGRDHDCVLGISGGVDSSYLAYRAVQFGLRPLAVHLDNGWDSELAIQNIERLVSTLGLELHTHVVDWQEFRALQVAYLRASVLDMEVLTDHAITAIAYRTAIDEGLRFLLTGLNVATESILPKAWHYRKSDLRNLRAIAECHGNVRLQTLPTASTVRQTYWRFARRIHSIDLLNYLDYNRSEAVATLEREVGWRDYGGKHNESTFTRFYQGYILPTKFGIDKRKAHLSSMICSGQITREQALAELEKPIYDDDTLRDHHAYVVKKLGLTDAEFDEIMKAAPRPHTDYPNDGWYTALMYRGISAAAAIKSAANRALRRPRSATLSPAETVRPSSDS